MFLRNFQVKQRNKEKTGDHPRTAERLRHMICGGAALIKFLYGVVMVTLPMVAVLALLVFPLATTSPTWTGSVMVTVVLEPTWVQEVPSRDLYAFKVLPVRTTLTHQGAVVLAVTVVAEVEPPAAVRRVKEYCFVEMFL
jgi:hypothetical protein